MTVTVCIPAYKAGGFIAETVASALGQTHADLRVLVAIDPPEDGDQDTSAAALEPFLEDPRVEVVQNTVRLGWAANVHALLGRVESDHYAVLPHDDIWAPTYVERLLRRLESVPEASVAYADLMFFGAPPAARKAVVLPAHEDRATHVLRFLLQGAEAMPWRGITRRSALETTDGFPRDGHMGYAVECEYALDLLVAGRALHLPRVLYFKRRFPQRQVTAAQARLRLQATGERANAWHAHARAMARRLETALDVTAADAAIRALSVYALTAALMRRWQASVQAVLPDGQFGAAREACNDALGVRHPMAHTVAAQLHLVLRTHFLVQNERAAAEDHLHRAAALDPHAADVLAARANALVGEGHLLEALGDLAEARTDLANTGTTVETTIERVYGQLGWLPSRDAE